MSASLIFFSRLDLSVSYLVYKTNPKVSILFTNDISTFKLVKSDFDANLDVSTPAAPFKLDFLA